MKAFILMFLLLMMFSQGCNRNLSSPQGGQQEWDQKQEQIERQEMEQEELRQIEEKNREVHYRP